MSGTFEQAKTFFMRGLEHDTAGRYADAERDYAASLALLPGRASTLTNLGAVRLKLFKGSCHVVGRKSPFALYDQALATYDAGDMFDRGATEGFIKIWGLPIETAARKAAPRPAGVR